MNGYNGYNQVKMAKKNKEKIVFISQWGAYAYNVCHLAYVMLQQLIKKL
jgi:hypothetical protein